MTNKGSIAVPANRLQSKVRVAKPRTAPAAPSNPLFAFVAGVGFLTLVVAGAVSQLWDYPYVRAAMLRSTDDLLFATFIGYFGASLLLKTKSTAKMAIRVVGTGSAILLLLGACFLLLRAMVPLGGIFAECIKIEDMPPACNIQIEEYRTMSPEKRKELSVL